MQIDWKQEVTLKQWSFSIYNFEFSVPTRGRGVEEREEFMDVTYGSSPSSPLSLSSLRVIIMITYGTLQRHSGGGTERIVRSANRAEDARSLVRPLSVRASEERGRVAACACMAAHEAKVRPRLRSVAGVAVVRIQG